jgi:hypothetical protein
MIALMIAVLPELDGPIKDEISPSSREMSKFLQILILV